MQSLRIMDIYILAKFHPFMLFGFSVMRLGGGGEEDEQNSIIAPCIYDARHHPHPYILSTTVLSDMNISSLQLSIARFSSLWLDLRVVEVEKPH